MNDLAARRFAPEATERNGTVFSAISAVQADLSREGVGKNGTNEQQKFKFRAWDDVQQALSPILAKHKVFVVPRVLTRECAERTTRSGSTQFHVVLSGELQFVSGVDGSTFAYPCMGEAMDTGDKATSKAMTMMVKYGLLHGLQIPLQGVGDSDAETPAETTAPRITPTSGLWEALDADTQYGLAKLAEECVGMLANDDAAGAIQHIDSQKLSNDEKAALWTRFASHERTAMKKAADKLKKAQEAQ